MNGRDVGVLIVQLLFMQNIRNVQTHLQTSERFTESEVEIDAKAQIVTESSVIRLHIYTDTGQKVKEEVRLVEICYLIPAGARPRQTHQKTNV